MKKVLSLMMTLVMMFGLVSVAATEAQAAEHKHCICGGKAAGVGEHKTCEDVTYTELTAELAASALPEGNYYLTADLQLADQLTFAENAKVNICLNGFKLKSASDKSVIMVNQGGIKLSIADCKGTGVLEGNAAKAGSCMYLNGTAVVVNMFGGTCAYNTTAAAGHGANVCVNNDGTTFNMYGGTIKDGATTSALAGNVYVKKGAMNMYGGSILNGVSLSNGGNLVVSANTSCNIYNGTITGGKVTKCETTGKEENSDITCWGALAIYNLEESFYIKYGSSLAPTAKDELAKTMDSSLTLKGSLIEADGTTRYNTLVEKTKASTGTQTGGTTTGGTTTGGTSSSTPATGDMANPVIVALVMVVAAVGMVYFVPKKRRA